MPELLTVERIDHRIPSYLSSPEILKAYEYPDPLSRSRQQEFNRHFFGAKYVLTYSILDEKLVMVPAGHPLNTTPLYSHSIQYGSAVFEGLRVKRDINGNANVILFKPRVNKRLPWSLQGRGIELPVPLEVYAQGILDMLAVQFDDILTGPNGEVGEAYLRPTVLVGLNGIGIGRKPGTEIIVGAIAHYFPSYFIDKNGVDQSERVYHGKGLRVVGLPVQRVNDKTGKHSSDYANAGVVGNEARKYGDEALYFAPYKIDDEGNFSGFVNLKYSSNLEMDMLETALCDGAGEELCIIVDDIVYYTPMETNRLGGTTLEFFKKMGKNLGLTFVERNINFKFILDMQRQGHKVSMFLLGNAVRIAPVGELQCRDNSGHEILRIEFNPEQDNQSHEIVHRFENETSRVIEPSDPLLLTRLENGREARKFLDGHFINW